MKKVLSLCDYTGIMVEPWAEAGYPCVCVDIKHRQGVTEGGNVTRIGEDILDWLPHRAEYAIVFAFPPCTNLASSGARWFKDKGLRGLIEGLELVERCRTICEWAGCRWMLENPIGTLATYWRKPDHKFHPHEYGGYLDPPGDAYTKATCLWTGGGFVMPEKDAVLAMEGSKMHRLPETDDRAEIRSATPAGFARAVFEANAV